MIWIKFIKIEVSPKNIIEVTSWSIKSRWINDIQILKKVPQDVFTNVGRICA